jgi:hypothetical protein
MTDPNRFCVSTPVARFLLRSGAASHLSVLPCFKTSGELPLETDARSFVLEPSKVESGLTAQPEPIKGRVLDNVVDFLATPPLLSLTGL